LFLDPKEIIYHSRPVLCYKVRLDICEVVNWHVPSPMSSSSSDSDSEDYPCFYQPTLSQSWPKRIQLAEQGDSSAPPPPPPSQGGAGQVQLGGFFVGRVLIPWPSSEWDGPSLMHSRPSYMEATHGSGAQDKTGRTQPLVANGGSVQHVDMSLSLPFTSCCSEGCTPMTFADPMDLKSKQEPLQNRHVLLVSPSPVHGCILVVDCDTFIGLGDRATVEPFLCPLAP
jgi:hypothetical protein